VQEPSSHRNGVHVVQAAPPLRVSLLEHPDRNGDEVRDGKLYHESCLIYPSEEDFLEAPRPDNTRTERDVCACASWLFAMPRTWTLLRELSRSVAPVPSCANGSRWRRCLQRRPPSGTCQGKRCRRADPQRQSLREHGDRVPASADAPDTAHPAPRPGRAHRRSRADRPMSTRGPPPRGSPPGDAAWSCPVSERPTAFARAAGRARFAPGSPPSRSRCGRSCRRASGWPCAPPVRTGGRCFGSR